jgi:GNAT superfamily N-acetyltransferase
LSTRTRPATRADVPLILALIRELATYEREPDAVVATEGDLLRDGFGDQPAFEVLIAEVNGVAVGFALYFFTYSTWRGRQCLYLEDLFVRPEQRGQGAGLALMRGLAREALRRNCPRFCWQVLDWNEPSIAFYERLGAKVAHEWLTIRLDGDALAALAAPE